MAIVRMTLLSSNPVCLGFYAVLSVQTFISGVDKKYQLTTGIHIGIYTMYYIYMYISM